MTSNLNPVVQAILAMYDPSEPTSGFSVTPTVTFPDRFVPDARAHVLIRIVRAISLSPEGSMFRFAPVHVTIPAGFTLVEERVDQWSGDKIVIMHKEFTEEDVGQTVVTTLTRQSRWVATIMVLPDAAAREIDELLG